MDVFMDVFTPYPEDDLTHDENSSQMLWERIYPLRQGTQYWTGRKTSPFERESTFDLWTCNSTLAKQKREEACLDALRMDLPHSDRGLKSTPACVLCPERGLPNDLSTKQKGKEWIPLDVSGDWFLTYWPMCPRLSPGDSTVGWLCVLPSILMLMWCDLMKDLLHCWQVGFPTAMRARESILKTIPVPSESSKNVTGEKLGGGKGTGASLGFPFSQI